MTDVTSQLGPYDSHNGNGDHWTNPLTGAKRSLNELPKYYTQRVPLAAAQKGTEQAHETTTQRMWLDGDVGWESRRLNLSPSLLLFSSAPPSALVQMAASSLIFTPS